MKTKADWDGDGKIYDYDEMMEVRMFEKTSKIVFLRGSTSLKTHQGTTATSSTTTTMTGTTIFDYSGIGDLEGTDHGGKINGTRTY